MYRSKVEQGQHLRKEQTPHERKLWRFLRALQFQGLKFRRQHEIGPYVVDFCCPEKSVVIELDGGGHGEEKQKKYDGVRDSYLEKRGYKVIRIWNHELLEETEGVMEAIQQAVRSRPASPSPQPSPQREREN